LGSLVLILDQVTKFFILKNLAWGKIISVIPGFFDVVHVHNKGAAFGMLHTLSDSIRVPFFYFITLIAIIVIIYAFQQVDEKNKFYAYPLSLICGGVLGNVLDRIRFGYVIDFLSVHIHDKILFGIRLEWPAFNVADSAITVSMVLIVVQILRGR